MGRVVMLFLGLQISHFKCALKWDLSTLSLLTHAKVAGAFAEQSSALFPKKAKF